VQLPEVEDGLELVSSCDKGKAFISHLLPSTDFLKLQLEFRLGILICIFDLTVRDGGVKVASKDLLLQFGENAENPLN